MRFVFVLLWTTLVLATSATHAQDNQPANTPNVVLILADDMGWGDPQCYNPNGKIATPHIDRIAQEGILFTDVHSPGAVCVPTRYGILTGRYPMRAELDLKAGPGIESGRLTLPGFMRDHGYATTMVGKWHLGFAGGENQPYIGTLEGGPFDRGFSSFFGMHASLDIPPYFYIRNQQAVMPPTDDVAASSSAGWTNIQGAFWREGKIAPNFKHEEVLPRFRDEAVAALKSLAADGNPFFLYVALPAPHTPWLPTEEFRGKSQVGMYGDFVMQVDSVVGDILQALDDDQLTEETLVIFTSDNGPVWYEQDTEKFNHSAVGPLRGIKADGYEGGHRMPFLVRWPGQAPANTRCDSLICQTDLLATMADIFDTALPENAVVDSHSFLSAITQPQLSPVVRETLILKKNATVIRKGDWKLITHLGSGGFSAPRNIKPSEGGPQGQLFNLSADLSESHNVWAEHPELVAELELILKAEKSRE